MGNRCSDVCSTNRILALHLLILVSRWSSCTFMYKIPLSLSSITCHDATIQTSSWTETHSSSPAVHENVPEDNTELPNCPMCISVHVWISECSLWKKLVKRHENWLHTWEISVFHRSDFNHGHCSWTHWKSKLFSAFLQRPEICFQHVCQCPQQWACTTPPAQKTMSNISTGCLWFWGFQTALHSKQLWVLSWKSLHGPRKTVQVKVLTCKEGAIFSGLQFI